MIPVLTPEEMAGVDRQAPDPVEVLIGRAGAAVARAARRQLSQTYGSRVVVVAGKGNNGADGRAAATLLRRQGAGVQVLEAAELAPGQRLPDADLVIDAAYGTGLRGSYAPPDPRSTPVLAVDIPSGLSGLTGQVAGAGDDQQSGKGGAGAMPAAATVTFAALKPGHLLADGPRYCGPVEVADIGLGPGVAGAAQAWLVSDTDVAAALPRRPHQAHKWQSAVRVIAGSPGMTGAAWMASTAAMRSGAGYVRLSVPGAEAGSLGLPPSEVVVTLLPAGSTRSSTASEPGDGEPSDGGGGPEWVEAVLADLERFGSLVVGPGLGSSGRGPGGGQGPGSAVGRLVAAARVPVVIDADGLNALGSLAALAEVTASRAHPTVITPHDGEFARLAGAPLGADRLAAARDAARQTGAVVLLKGSTTVVATPAGTVLLSASGSPRLATAGTGDVLSGVIGAFLARGMPAELAAALGAHVHGRAAGLGRDEGLVASDLPELVSSWLSELPAPAAAAIPPATPGSMPRGDWYGRPAG